MGGLWKQYSRFLKHKPDVLGFEFNGLVDSVTFEGYNEKIKELDPSFEMPSSYRGTKYPSRPSPPAPVPRFIGVPTF